MSLEIELKRENEKRDENRLVLEQLAGKVERNDNVWSEEDKAAYDAAVAIENETSTKIENIQRSLEARNYLSKGSSSKPVATPVAAPSRISRSIGDEEQNILLQSHILTAAGRGDLMTSTHKKVVSSLGYNPNHSTISRSQSLGDNATGGYLAVNSVFEAIEKRIASFGGLRAAATVKSRPNGTPYHYIPANNTGRSVAAIVGENTDNATADVTFGAPISFKDIKFRSDVFPVSYELLQNPNVDVKQFFADEIAESIARGSEAKFLTGNGSTEPGGIITESGVGVTCASAIAIALDELKALTQSVDVHYRNGASFMMHETVYNKICEAVYTDTRLVFGDWINGFVKQILGYPVIINNSMDPAITANKTPILFGQLSKYEIGEITYGGSAVQLRTLVERYAELDAVGMMGIYHVDAHLKNTWAVKKLKMAAS